MELQVSSCERSRCRRPLLRGVETGSPGGLTGGRAPLPGARSPRCHSFERMRGPIDPHSAPPPAGGMRTWALPPIGTLMMKPPRPSVASMVLPLFEYPTLYPSAK